MKKGIEIINRNQEEMKNTISEIKNKLEGIASRMDEAEDWISELEDKVDRNTHLEQQTWKKNKKYKDSLSELQDNMKCNNIWIIGIPEGKEKEQGIETLFEKIMTENFPKGEDKGHTSSGSTEGLN